MKSGVIQLDERNFLKTTEVGHGWGMPKTMYCQIQYIGDDGKSIEWGFISPDGIFLKMEHPVLDGVWERIPLAADPAFSVKEKVKRFVTHYKAIYDRYSTIVRGK